jgi:hypothetical protein
MYFVIAFSDPRRQQRSAEAALIFGLHGNCIAAKTVHQSRFCPARPASKKCQRENRQAPDRMAPGARNDAAGNAAGC